MIRLFSGVVAYFTAKPACVNRLSGMTRVCCWASANERPHISSMDPTMTRRGGMNYSSHNNFKNVVQLLGGGGIPAPSSPGGGPGFCNWRGSNPCAFSEYGGVSADGGALPAGFSTHRPPIPLSV